MSDYKTLPDSSTNRGGWRVEPMPGATYDGAQRYTRTLIPGTVELLLDAMGDGLYRWTLTGLPWQHAEYNALAHAKSAALVWAQNILMEALNALNE